MESWLEIILSLRHRRTSGEKIKDDAQIMVVKMISEPVIDYQKLFSEMAVELREMDDSGTVASYIPELRNVDPNKFGIHLTTIDNQNYCLGDSNDKFSIQSTSKVLALSLAFELEDDKLWDRVGVEPSGTPFNSLVQLEYEKGIPRNPLINAGALVICDVLVSRLKNPKQEFIAFVRKVSGNQNIDYCPRVAGKKRRRRWYTGDSPGAITVLSSGAPN